MADAQGWLTTHVLDAARGAPAEGVAIALYRISGQSHKKIATATTNADGRTDAPILAKGKMTAGRYELVFLVGPYLERHGLASADPAREKFLDEVPIRFGIDDETAHYHVPLLLSPFSYSTYRGS